MNSTFCDFSCNWSFNIPLENIIKYNYDLNDINTHNLNESDPSPSYQVESDDFIQFTKVDLNLENCVVRFQCIKPYTTKIKGIRLISESRTLEISNDVDGYLSTIRGKEFSCHESSTFYLCECSFEEAYSNLSVKFLSLKEKSSFVMKSFTVYLAKSNDVKTYNRGTFDVQKLQKEIELMGDNVSEKAKDFFKTIQHFEKNKMKMFEDLDQCQPQPSNLQREMTSIKLPSMFGLFSMDSLCTGTEADSNIFSRDESDLYAMLQGVCDSVSRKRLEEMKNKSSPLTPDSGTESISAMCSAQGQEDIHKQISSDHSQILDVVDDKLNQVKREFEDKLLRTKEELSEKLENTKHELNGKLDLILKLLNNSIERNGITE